MYTFLSGDKALAEYAIKALIRNKELIDQHRADGKELNLSKLLTDPGFSLLPEGDYRFKISLSENENSETHPNVYNGQTSYVCWPATVKYKRITIMELEHTSVTNS